MERASRLFRKKCNVCQTERSDAAGNEGSCQRADDPAMDRHEFLPAPLAHYCCRCALRAGWGADKFHVRGCTGCVAKVRSAQEDRETELFSSASEARDAENWLAPAIGVQNQTSPRPLASIPCPLAHGAENPGEEGGADDEQFVKIGWCDESARGDEGFAHRAHLVKQVQQECDAIRAAAIQEATREAELEVARILSDAQDSARQQAAEERVALLQQAREQAQAITARAQADARQELNRVLIEADKIMQHAAAEAASIVDEARTSVAPAGAWVEVGLSGSGGWHRPGMAVFFRGELAAATNQFGPDCCVGAGGFGSVFRAEHIQGLCNGAAMAVKRLDAGSMQGQGEFLQELQVLGTHQVTCRMFWPRVSIGHLTCCLLPAGACRHEHLLPVLGFAADPEGDEGSTVCLVTPLMVGGNLEDRLLASRGDLTAQRRLQCLAPAQTGSCPPLDGASCFGRGKGANARRRSDSAESSAEVLSWQDRVRCCVSLLRALVYLHTADDTRCKPAILHRDIKPANVLLDAQNNARLADVGLAQILKPSKSHVSNSTLAGTHGFIDPHYSQTGHYDTSADGYAVGITMLMALTARPAFDDNETIVDRCCKATASIIADKAAHWPAETADRFLAVALGLTCSPRRDRMPVAQALRVLEEICEQHAIPVYQAEEGDERECVMCMCRPRQVRFGCGHRVLCEGCLRHLLARAEPSCPCCCQPVSEDLVVADYMVSHEKKTASLRMARLTDFLPCPPANLSVSRSFKLPWE